MDPWVLGTRRMKMSAVKLTLSLLTADGVAFRGVTARLEFRPSRGLRVLRTDDDGRIVTGLPKGARDGRLEFGPIPGHWSIGADVQFAGSATREWHAAPLPAAVECLGWWHRAIGLRKVDLSLGQRLRVGVIDTGCSPHPALKHVKELGTFVGGKLAQPGVDDQFQHGTHVCGIIGARPDNEAQFIGIAPAAQVLVARVQTAESGPATQADIANALDALVAETVHLVNISLSAQAPSPPLVDSLVAAWLHGVVCFAAAGNTGGEVMWPARHDPVVAVTALGRDAEVPPGSLGALLLAGARQTDDSLGLTLPDFCCRGPQVRCCAPGVGIISAIGTACGPSWADMSGTSMASPFALGTLASVLGRDAEYLAAGPDEERAKRAVEVLREHCLPLALDVDAQGDGLVVLDVSSILG